MRKRKLKVKEVWLEGNDLHIVNLKGKHITYKNITIVKREQDFSSIPSNMEVHEQLMEMIKVPVTYTVEIRRFSE